MFNKGIYIPKDRSKLVYNVHSFEFRSSWECDFMEFCDGNDTVIKWSFENYWIPYFNPALQRIVKYRVDFYTQMKLNNGRVIKALVEVKPIAGVLKPNPINKAKWKSAYKYCLEKNMKFLLAVKRRKEEPFKFLTLPMLGFKEW